jgi:hypothetical protein
LKGSSLRIGSLNREYYLRGRLCTVDLLIKVACFVKRKINFQYANELI